MKSDARMGSKVGINPMGHEMNVAGLGRVIGKIFGEGEIGSVHTAGADKITGNNDDRAWLMAHGRARGSGFIFIRLFFDLHAGGCHDVVVGV
jgi:hypothetical protein